MREADRHSVLASPCSRPPARSTVRKLAPHPMWLLPRPHVRPNKRVLNGP